MIMFRIKTLKSVQITTVHGLPFGPSPCEPSFTGARPLCVPTHRSRVPVRYNSHAVLDVRKPAQNYTAPSLCVRSSAHRLDCV